MENVNPFASAPVIAIVPFGPEYFPFRLPYATGVEIGVDVANGLAVGVGDGVTAVDGFGVGDLVFTARSFGPPLLINWMANIKNKIKAAPAA